MTQPDAPGPLAKLSWKTLLTLAVIMPAIGNMLTITPLYLHHLSVLNRGASGPITSEAHVDHIYFFPSPGGVWLSYFMIGLWLNLIGALSLLAVRAAWRRLGRS